jgi:hypothetical protein
LVCHEVKWNKAYEELVEFHTANGHCNVPLDDSSLGNWVNQQRRSRKNNNPTNNRIKLLDDLGFAWNQKDPSIPASNLEFIKEN